MCRTVRHSPISFLPLACVLTAGCYAGVDPLEPLELGGSDDGAEDDDGFDDGFDDGNDADDDSGADDDGEPVDDGEPETPDERDAINAYVASLGTPQSPADSLEPAEPTAPAESGDYMCSTQSLTETQQFDRIVAFAANSGTLWPGAIIGADSITSGLFTPKVLPRAPMTFSASLEGVLEGDVSATLETPSLSAFRDAMGDILDQEVVGMTPANIYSQIEEVYSSEQLSFALGVNADWIQGNIEASLSFSNEETRSRFVVNFTQSYYTVDVDPPGTAADFWAQDVALDDVEAELSDEPPAYVNSVTFGRLVYFTITSNYSAEEVRAALDFGFQGQVSVDGSVSLTHEEVLDESEITAHILGGNGDIAVQAVYGVEELREFIESGGSWSADSPGAPIAYKLAYLHDDSPARYALVTDYEVEECERVSQDVRVALDHLTVVADGSDGGSALELYGNVWVEDAEGNAYWLWSQPEENAVAIENGQSWPLMGELGSQIVPVAPEAGEALYLRVSLADDDPAPNPDDSFGNLTIARPFEDGWRAEVPVSAADGDQHIEIHFSLTPVG